MPAKVRLNKYLRDCQLGSRRRCEQLITDGLVTLNGKRVEQLATLVDPDGDSVEVSGKPVRPFEETIYVAAYKPRGVVVTASDPGGRATLLDGVQGLPAKVFSIGRLDMDSEGLIILTNDGKLAFRLAHPRYEIERVYEVRVKGEVGEDLVRGLRAGVDLEEGLVRPRAVTLLRANERGSTLRLTLTEGKKREIRRMIAACGYEVARLKRVRFGSLALGDLVPGRWRYLTRDEVRSLRRLVQEAHEARLSEDRPGKRSGRGR